jgi:hypothetical protein
MSLLQGGGSLTAVDYVRYSAVFPFRAGAAAAAAAAVLHILGVKLGKREWARARTRETEAGGERKRRRDALLYTGWRHCATLCCKKGTHRSHEAAA